jgi:L-ascorbate metabolism protein UlaG (beta-lactamase superfamily)
MNGRALKYLILMSTLCAQVACASMNEPKSHHFDGKYFRNPNGKGAKSFGDLIRWLSETKTPWPEWINDPNPSPLENPIPAGELRVTFINHATFLLRTKDWYLITDPHFTKRASPVSFAGPKRVRRPAFDIQDIKQINYVMISHNHYDHLDIGSIKKLKENFDPFFLVPLKNGSLLESATVKKDRYGEYDWWQSFENKNIKITLTPAQHWSARGMFDRNEMLWGGFIIEWSGLKVFFAGDTGFDGHFEEIYRRFGPMDLALLPIGAYAPRWFMKDSHMNPEEALQAHLALRAKMSMGMHFGTFRLTNEGIDDPERELAAARKKAGLNDDVFHVPAFGETISIKR